MERITSSIAALLFIAGCGAPDRWQTSVARGSGGLSGGGLPGRDFEETTLEVGVSGQLGSPPATHSRRDDAFSSPHTPFDIETSKPHPQESAEIPWEALIALLCGAGGLAGAQQGRKAYRSRKESKA